MEKIAAKISRSSFEVKEHPRLLAKILPKSFEAAAFYNLSYSDVNYNADMNIVSGISVTWIEGSGGLPYFPDFSGRGGSCDPEKSYCRNVEIGATMREPEGSGQPESGSGCNGIVEVNLYMQYEIESGKDSIDGNHRGAINLSSEPACSIQGEDFSATSQDFVTVSLPKVETLLNGNTITNTTQDVVVGQQIILSAQVTNGTPSNPQWIIPGNKVENYVVTYTNPTSPTSAVVTELTSQNLTQSPVKFYWIDGADSRQVQYSVRIRNRNYTATATFNVNMPSLSVSTSSGLVFLNYNVNYVELTAERLSYPA